VFADRGCIDCHDPQRRFTTDKTYDVGVVDELGNRQFNPPSLLGLRWRRKFLHDSRFSNLVELLQEHPRASMNWEGPDLDDLLRYLESL
jgi:cytochrome c peroxidase